MPFPFVLLLVLASLQAPNAPSNDAVALLNEVGKHYADAKSYHIEAVEEVTTSTELHRDWSKTLLTAIVMPGGRYRYEGRSGFGSATLVSDGTTQWDYHAYDHLYTQRPAPRKGQEMGRIITQQEGSLWSAKQIVQYMAHRADHLKSANLLPDESITIDGKSIACYVIHYSSQDFETKQSEAKFEWTLWIDKSRKVVLKTYSHGESYLQTEGHGRIPLHEETSVTYSTMDLDSQEPASLFTFAVPTDAKLVETFPGYRGLPEEVDLEGKPAPELQFKSPDGKTTALSSFRGKPVFIEFWATWCAPCVDLMPDLAKLYSETADKGLVWMSFDNDNDPSIAAEFISRENIPWPNYHDGDGASGKAFHRLGIPLGVLIDAKGEVTFYRTGYEISELRSAIVKLGPEFGSVASARTAAK
jgi:thiol-disulfide isomerase/thioredoxin/outer membrane lipoprotein-sorting protein